MNSFLKKSLVATLIAGVLIPSAFSQVKKERETEEQKAARKARMYKKLGGHVINKGTMKGKFIFINTQTAIPEEPLRETAKSMADFLMSDFSLQHSDTPVSFVDAAKTIKASGATAGVVIGKDAAMPALTIVPDSLCAYINVTPLEGDAKLSPRRVRLEMWRALGYLYGIDFEGCMLHPVKTIDELDELPNALSQEALYHITHTLEQSGITPSTRATYRTACKEGWAPAPTNDVQQAIWNEFHELPSKPITIEFDPKKGK